MSWLLAAVGATVVALFESTVKPYLALDGAHPHLVVVLGIVWTVAVGAESGLVWGFVAGVALDVFAQRPVGSTAFVLLVSLGAAAILAPSLSRIRPFSPIPLVFVLSFVNSLLLLAVYGALRAPIPDPEPFRTLLPGVLYDTVIAVLVGPLAIVLWDRRRESARADW
jgi:rod shape-determining protein MreD